MTATPRLTEPNGTSVRQDRWLPALERELKSRVGWADEAVSPFASGRRPTQTPSEIQRAAIQTGMAAA
jgi:hypothetical protein